MDIRDYLCTIYPEADDEEIDSYLQLVITHDSEKLPPTKAVIRFREIKLEIDKLEAEQAKVRSDVIKQFETLSHQISGLSISKPSPKSYDKDKFYDWAVANLPEELIAKCRKQVIDEKLLLGLAYEGKFDISLLPDDVYKQTEQTRIEIEGNRKKKDEKPKSQQLLGEVSEVSQ